MTLTIAMLYRQTSQQCTACCPTCRDGCVKIFQKPLDAKKVLKNRSKGIDLRSALTATSNSEVSGNIGPIRPWPLVNTVL